MNARRKFKGAGEKPSKWYEQKKEHISSSPDPFSIRRQFERDHREIQKINSVRKIVSPERAKLPSLKDSWHNTRDISHLKDTKQEISPVYVGFPTDIEALKKLNKDPSSARQGQKENELPLELENIEKIMLGNPSGRQEIENLSKWFLFMKEKYIDSPTNPDEYFGNCSEIYNSCLKEIIRQVAVHCYDRGRLLKQVLTLQDSLLAEKQKKKSDDTLKKVNTLHEELNTVKNERNDIIEEYDNKTISLYDKISEYIQEISKQKDIIHSLQSTVQQRTEVYFDLKTKFQKKKTAIKLLMKSLEESHIKIPSKILNLIEESSEISLKPTLKNKLIEKDSEVNLVQCEDKETQTNLKIVKRRYSVNHKPSKHKYRLQHSFNDFHNLSKYEVEDHFNSLVDIDPDSSYSSKPNIESISNQITARDLFVVYENEIQQSFIEESDHPSWEHNSENKDSKASEAEFQQTPQDLEYSFDGSSEFKYEEDDEENESFDDIFEDHKISPEKTKNAEMFRANTERLIQPESFNKRVFKCPGKKSQRLVTRSGKRVTKFKEFNWHRRKDSTSNQRKMSEVNILLHNLFRKKLHVLQKRGNISIKMLNRFISNVYLASMGKNKNTDGDHLVEIMYDEIAFRYGFKTVADRKFIEIICSLLRFHKGKRKMFLKFIGAGEKIGTNNYSRYSLRLFLTMHHYLLNAKIGINVHRSEHSDVVLLPALRALECLKEKVEPLMGKSEVNRLLNWVDSNSAPDYKKINPNGVINMDKFLFQVIETYEVYQLSVYEGIFTLFQAFMSDESYISAVEFEMLMRYLKHDRLKKEDDNENEFVAELESYTFEQLFIACIEKNLLNLKDIKRTLKENSNPRELIQREKDKLCRLLESYEDSDFKFKTLSCEVFRDRIHSLEQSVGEVKDSIVAIGWKIYSLEILRLNDLIANK